MGRQTLSLTSFKHFGDAQAATPGCTKEACAFRDAYGKFQDAGAEVFGISSDDVQKNSEFAKVTPLPRCLCTHFSDDAWHVRCWHTHVRCSGSLASQAQRLPYPLLTDQSEFLRKSFGIKGDLLGYALAAPHMLPAIMRNCLQCHRHSNCLLICSTACSSSPVLAWLASSGANGDMASSACSSLEH